MTLTRPLARQKWRQLLECGSPLPLSLDNGRPPFAVIVFPVRRAARGCPGYVNSGLFSRGQLRFGWWRMDTLELDTLQERLAYSFKDPQLLVRALTHSSLLQERPEEKESNQRLEFLGDAVLQLVLTEALFELYPDEREGALSKRRAALSKGEFLAELAGELELAKHLRFGHSEEVSGGRERRAALEDAFEALIGAVFVDSDYTHARQVVLKVYGSLTERLTVVTPGENPKGQLQERVQPVHGNAALRYVCEHIAGEDHAREYEARVYLRDLLLGTGRGSSKKSAEEAAAREALESREL